MSTDKSTKRVAPGIGCAGWSIPSFHAKLFGDANTGLAKYATRFDAVEINSSFYRPHLTKTYERWAGAVPRQFRFSVKLPKTITHEGRLHSAGAELDRFQGQVCGLGQKLAGILVQLPPSLSLDARIAATFLRMLRRRFDVGIALEARHASWFTPAATTLLERYDTARVAADPALFDGADVPVPSSYWAYWRWHGSPRMYYSEYSEEALSRLALNVRTFAKTRPWVIFDNTAHGHAVADAARLQAKLHTIRAPL